jgi:hypothetical protein
MGRDHQEEVITLLKDIQRRVTYLEKKVDAFSAGSSDRKSSKSRNHSSSSSSRSSAGTRPSPEGSRYKSKHESAYGDKESSSSRWYDKKGGAGLSASAKNKKTHKTSNKRDHRSK